MKKETLGRQGQTPAEPAHTREVKLGCVFTQATWDQAGYAIRDPDSTTYVAAIETAEEFGKRIYREAWKRGWSRAEKKVFLGMDRNGLGTSPIHISPTPLRWSIAITLANTGGTWRASCTPTQKPNRDAG